MGLLSRLRRIIRVERAAREEPEPDPEDLLEMTGAHLTMETDLGYDSLGEAALCFSGVDREGFEATVEEVTEVLDASESQSGTVSDLRSDDHGFRWVVVRDDAFEDLVSTLHFVADAFVEAGYEDRLLAAVFGFRKDADAYWIYSFERGTYYPFVPDGDEERDVATEFKLETALDGDLRLEESREEWYPLWPSAPGRRPWE